MPPPGTGRSGHIQYGNWRRGGHAPSGLERIMQMLQAGGFGKLERLGSAHRTWPGSAAGPFCSTCTSRMTIGGWGTS